MRTNRPSFDELFMRTAELWSERATCPRLSVGAVIAKDEYIIAASFNGAPRNLPHCDPECSNNLRCARSSHAEENSIYQAARLGTSTVGTTLYSTHAACYPCARSILQVGIARFVYKDEYRTSTGLDLLREGGITVERYSDLTE